MKKILLVEDDAPLAEKTATYLQEAGFSVQISTNLVEARSHFSNEVDLALVDWLLPDGEGTDLVREWRALRPSLPILMLTARATTTDKVVALELGSDDHITKPFDPVELLARVRSQLRQLERLKSGSAADKIELGDITANFTNHEVFFKGELVSLTKMQFLLLKTLLQSPNQVFSRDELLNKVWGYNRYPTTRTVDNHVAQLRSKFSADLFETIHGSGYRFVHKGQQR